MYNVTVTIEEAKLLFEMGQISESEYKTFINIKVNEVKNVIAANTLDFSELVDDINQEVGIRK